MIVSPAMVERRPWGSCRWVNRRCRPICFGRLCLSGDVPAYGPDGLGALLLASIDRWPPRHRSGVEVCRERYDGGQQSGAHPRHAEGHGEVSEPGEPDCEGLGSDYVAGGRLAWVFRAAADGPP